MRALGQALEGDDRLVYDVERVNGRISKALRESVARGVLVRYLLGEGWGYNETRGEFVRDGDRGRPAWWPDQSEAWLDRPYRGGVAVRLAISGNRYREIAP